MLVSGFPDQLAYVAFVSIPFVTQAHGMRVGSLGRRKRTISAKYALPTSISSRMVFLRASS